MCKAPTTIMISSLPRSLLVVCCFWYILLPSIWALKFDLQAHSGSGGKYPRCIRNFVSRETLVVVTATVGGTKGDGQVVNMLVRVLPQLEESSLLTSSCRSKTPTITSTGGRRTLSERPGWLSRRTPMPPSTYALRTY